MKMFDISIAELGTVGVVALLILGPKDFVQAVKYIRKTLNNLQSYLAENKIIDTQKDYTTAPLTGAHTPDNKKDDLGKIERANRQQKKT